VAELANALAMAANALMVDFAAPSPVYCDHRNEE